MTKGHAKPAKLVILDDEPRSETARGVFPIVGVGASAGGLEALEQFFGQVPADSGLAWIVIQHQDPTHSSLLPELLQRKTSLPVMVASDQTSIQRDHIYVIPPDRELSVLDGKLLVRQPTVARGLRLPINVLFRSLAEERGSASVGVLLSGMGSDGTQRVSATSSTRAA